MGIISSVGKSGSRCAVTWSSLLSRSSDFGNQPIRIMQRIPTVGSRDGSFTITWIGRSHLRLLGAMALATLILGVVNIRSSTRFLICDARLQPEQPAPQHGNLRLGSHGFSAHPLLNH